MTKKSFQDIIADALDQDFLSLVESLSHGEALFALGLQAGHSEDDLRAAYKKAAKAHHPDMGGSLEGMKRVNAAYEKLKSSSSGSGDHDDDSLLKAARHAHSGTRFNAARHPGLKAHHIHAILDKEMEDGSDESLASSVAMEHPSVDASHLDKAMKHWDEDIRERAIKHPKSEEHHLDLAFGDDSFFVRKAAIQHPKVKMRHIEKALADDDDEVRSIAIEHLRKRGVFKD